MPIIVHLHLQLSTTHSEEKDIKAFLSAGPFLSWGLKKMASRDGVFPRFKFRLYISIRDARSEDARTSEKPFFNPTSNFMCCRPRFGSSRSLCTYLSVLKLGEIKSIFGISPLLIEIIGVFSQNFSNFIWWGVTRGMRVRLEDYGRRTMARQESP